MVWSRRAAGDRQRVLACDRRRRSLGHGLAISAAGGGEHNPPPRSRRWPPAQWFSRSGLQSRVVGFDVSGDPVVEASSKDVMEAWLVTSPSVGTKLLALTPTAAQQNPNGPGRPASACISRRLRGRRRRRPSTASWAGAAPDPPPPSHRRFTQLDAEMTLDSPDSELTCTRQRVELLSRGVELPSGSGHD
jgi:hypothetical protein